MSNPFKNFCVFNLHHKAGPDVTTMDLMVQYIPDDVSLNVRENQEDGMPFMADDPTGGQWGCSGFAAVEDGAVFADLEGAGWMTAIDFRERILPAKVRDKEVKKRADALAAQQGNKVNKKDYAQLKEQVEFELLPVSHIRSTKVLALLTPEDKLFVFTSSAKKAFDSMAIITGYLNNYFEIQASPLVVKNAVVSVLNGIARDEAHDDDMFGASTGMTMKGEGKRMIKIKDRDVHGHEIQELLNDDTYDVHELEMSFTDDGDDEPCLYFTINDKMVFKGVRIPDTVLTAATDKGDDGAVAFHSHAWLVARNYRNLIKHFIEEMGGEVSPSPESEAAQPATVLGEDEF